jgi:hypothetical protein
MSKETNNTDDENPLKASQNTQTEVTWAKAGDGKLSALETKIEEFNKHYTSLHTLRLPKVDTKEEVEALSKLPKGVSTVFLSGVKTEEAVEALAHLPKTVKELNLNVPQEHLRLACWVAAGKGVDILTNNGENVSSLLQEAKKAHGYKRFGSTLFGSGTQASRIEVQRKEAFLNPRQQSV